MHFANFIHIKPFEMINGRQNTFHKFRIMENITSGTLFQYAYNQYEICFNMCITVRILVCIPNKNNHPY